MNRIEQHLHTPCKKLDLEILNDLDTITQDIINKYASLEWKKAYETLQRRKDNITLEEYKWLQWNRPVVSEMTLFESLMMDVLFATISTFIK